MNVARCLVKRREAMFDATREDAAAQRCVQSQRAESVTHSYRPTTFLRNPVRPKARTA